MKKTKPLWRVSVITTLEAEDAVAEMLGSTFGVAAAAYYDLEKKVSLVSAFIEKNKRTVFTTKAARTAITAGLKRVAEAGLPLGRGEIEIARVKPEDWAESWKRHFHPLKIGRELLVKPSWSKLRPLKNQAVVILDPGLSFGTGQHPTTSFCLGEIVRCRSVDTPKSFLDIGTGSGILAISAAKLGYRPIFAFDFDPQSVYVASENIRTNLVAKQVKLTRGDVLKLSLKPARQFDLVCANLISNVLMAAREQIVCRVKPGGTLVLAGILATEFGLIKKEFARSGMKLVASRVENEWCSGSFCFV